MKIKNLDSKQSYIFLPSKIIDTITRHYSSHNDIIKCAKMAAHMIERAEDEKLPVYPDDNKYMYLKYKKFLSESKCFTKTRTSVKYENYFRIEIYSITDTDDMPSALIEPILVKKDNSITYKLQEKQEAVLEYSLVDLNKLYERLVNETDPKMTLNKKCAALNKANKFNTKSRFAKKGNNVDRLYSSFSSLPSIVKEYLFIIEEHGDKYKKSYFSSYDMKNAQARLLCLNMKRNGYKIDTNYIEDVFFSEDFYDVIANKCKDMGYTKFISNGDKRPIIHLLPNFKSYRDSFKEAFMAEIYYGNRCISESTVPIDGGSFVISYVFKTLYPGVFAYLKEAKRICKVQTYRILSFNKEYQKLLKSLKSTRVNRLSKEKREKEKKIIKKQLQNIYKGVSETYASSAQTFEAAIMLSYLPNTYSLTNHDCFYCKDINEIENRNYINRIVSYFTNEIDERITADNVFKMEHLALNEEIIDNLEEATKYRNINSIIKIEK